MKMELREELTSLSAFLFCSSVAAVFCKIKNPLQKLEFEKHEKLELTKGTDSTWYLARGPFPGPISWFLFVDLTFVFEWTEEEEACLALVVRANRNGVVAREEKGEQFGEGKWGFLVHQIDLQP